VHVRAKCVAGGDITVLDDREGPCSRWRLPAYDARVSQPRDPLTGIDRLLVDGSNLLPALARRGGQAPQAALIGRLRAAIPAPVGIELVFDGAPAPGLRDTRIAAGLLVRHGGRRSADALLIDLVDQARAVAGAAAAAGLLVITDDRALRVAVQSKGARTAGTAWLLGRLDRPRVASPSVGNRRPPDPGTTAPGAAAEEAERTPWKPGRGATRKRGNPRRGRPSSGSMRP
jgi:hypothetical protein